MIPVLGVPIISRPDLLARMLATVDVPVYRRIIVDNGGEIVPESLRPIRLPANIGIAAAWNLVIKLTPDAGWWFLVNVDIEFGAGDLERLVETMADPAAKVVNLTNDGFAAFGLNRAALDAVGFFDENFAPAYCEDADYEYRCTLAGVPVIHLPSNTRHARSQTLEEPRYARQNARTYPRNVAYYHAKWGGPLRGGERFTTPFDSGAGVEEWALVPARLRDGAWDVIETTALEYPMELR